jgi:hypothetical protein
MAAGVTFLPLPGNHGIRFGELFTGKGNSGKLAGPLSPTRRFCAPKDSADARI